MSVRLIKSDQGVAVRAFNMPGPSGISHLVNTRIESMPVPPAAASAMAGKAGTGPGAAARMAKAPMGGATAADDGAHAAAKPEKGAGSAMAEAGSAPDANEIVRQARVEAERLIAGAQSREAEIERAARERGLSGAQTEVRLEIDRAVADLRAQLASSLDEVAGLRADLNARAERDLVRLALEIARKVVHREVRVDHEIALTLARVALSRLQSRAKAVVRLHPDDYAYVSERHERLGCEASVEITEDRSVGPGGCVVQSEMGEIDARIEQQFAEIERDFLSA
ncbi:MAG: FliH/SctL family protein [Blastocatellia bacterium]